MKNHPARLEPGKGKYMLYFILNERAVSPLQNSFHKIGGASEKKIEQALFFPLGLHYLCKNYLFMEKDEIQKLTYSEAVAELEKIVREMQSDACSIDNLSRLTSRSLELLKVCKAKLLSTDEELKKILAELEA